MKLLREQTERAQQIYRKMEDARTREEYQDAKREHELFMMQLDRPTRGQAWRNVGVHIVIGVIFFLAIWGFIAWVINTF